MLWLAPVYLLGGAATIYAKRWSRWSQRGDTTDNALIFVFWPLVDAGVVVWHLSNALNGAEAVGRIDMLVWHMLKRKVDVGEKGILYIGPSPETEPLARLRVVDFTTKEIHWIRVPPNMERVEEALAWSFDMAEDDYAPEITS